LAGVPVREAKLLPENIAKNSKQTKQNLNQKISSFSFHPLPLCKWHFEPRQKFFWSSQELPIIA